MWVRRSNSILMFLAVALTTGCASAAEITPTLEATTLEAPTRQDQTPTPAATPTPGSRSSGAVITFERSGGIAGLSEHWTIQRSPSFYGNFSSFGAIIPTTPKLVKLP